MDDTIKQQFYGEMTLVNPLFLKGLRKWNFEKIHKKEKKCYLLLY